MSGWRHAEAHVHGFGRLSEGADRDEIDSGFGVAAVTLVGAVAAGLGPVVVPAVLTEGVGTGVITGCTPTRSDWDLAAGCVEAVVCCVAIARRYCANRWSAS